MINNRGSGVSVCLRVFFVCFVVSWLLESIDETERTPAAMTRLNHSPSKQQQKHNDRATESMGMRGRGVGC